MRIAIIFLAAFVTTTPAFAADFLRSCGPDILEYCSAVEPGHGRLISCLYAHELVIGEDCAEATTEMADIIDTMFASLREVQQSCSNDIPNLCGDVDAGGGRVFMCLAANKDTLSESCGAIIGVVQIPPE